MHISTRLYIHFRLFSVALSCLYELLNTPYSYKVKNAQMKTITTIYSSNIHSSVSGSTYCILFNLIVCVNENFSREGQDVPAIQHKGRSRIHLTVIAYCRVYYNIIYPMLLLGEINKEMISYVLSVSSTTSQTVIPSSFSTRLTWSPT